MTRLERILRQVTADLALLRIRWALVGGLAVSVRAEPRLTRDLDLAISVTSDKEAEALVFELGRTGYAILTSLEHESVDRLATVRLAPPGGMAAGVVVDLLFASSGIEPEVVTEAEELEILPGLVVPVARAGHLVALKLLARDDETRPQDRVDLRALGRELDPSDVVRARQAVASISERGFNRSRDLEATLEAFLRDVRERHDRTPP